MDERGAWIVRYPRLLPARTITSLYMTFPSSPAPRQAAMRDRGLSMPTGRGAIRSDGEHADLWGVRAAVA